MDYEFEEENEVLTAAEEEYITDIWFEHWAETQSLEQWFFDYENGD